MYKFEVKHGEGNRLYKALTFNVKKKASQETNRGVLKGKKVWPPSKNPVQIKVEFNC